MVKETRDWAPLTQKQPTLMAYILFLLRPVAISDAYALLVGGARIKGAATDNRPSKSTL
jgi:hypothetical protein